MFQYNLKIYFLLWPLLPTCTLCCGFDLMLLRSLLEFVVIWMFLSSFSDIYYSPVGLGFGSLWKLYVIYENGDASMVSNFPSMVAIYIFNWWVHKHSHTHQLVFFIIKSSLSLQLTRNCVTFSTAFVFPIMEWTGIYHVYFSSCFLLPWNIKLLRYCAHWHLLIYTVYI
jgi:hypothetical protein